MKFYGRKEELERLETRRRVAENCCSQMTCVAGRRGVGKTSVILQSLQEEPNLYFYVCGTSETILCRTFSETVRREFGLFVPSGISEFAELFELLLHYGKTRHYTLVLDDFQNFMQINPFVCDRMQQIWERTKKETKVHLILASTFGALNRKLSAETLLKSADEQIELQPFSVFELKNLTAESEPRLKEGDFDALMHLTGGVPSYVADLIDHGSLTLSSMAERLLSPTAPYILEGRELLRGEFGEGGYRFNAVLEAMSSGACKYAEIAEVSGVSNLSPYLDKLEKYGLIAKKHPPSAKPGTRKAIWYMQDPFLQFWYRYILPNEGLLNAGENQFAAEGFSEYSEFSSLINDGRSGKNV